MHKDQQEQVNLIDHNNKNKTNKTTLVPRFRDPRFQRFRDGIYQASLWPPALNVHEGGNRGAFQHRLSQGPLRILLPTMLVLLLLLISACAPLSGNGNSGSATPVPKKTSQPGIVPSQTPNTAADVCPVDLSASLNCQTPHSMRVAYGVQSLTQRGFTGKGQTVVDIVSFGSPTLQADMDTFDRQFGLPPITIKVIAPLNEKPYDPNNDRGGWGLETELDVEIIHALAPGAAIVVLVSPVAETEGTVGLPEFRQLEQYALAHHLGNIISQSWGASEVTLKNAAGQAEIRKWNTFFKQAVTQNGISIFSSSGDNGATDYTDLQASHLSPTPTTSFPADDPWVTSVGGTSLRRNGSTFSETAWNMSGGGFSSFFPEPSYQQMLPSPVQSELNHRRGVPDVSADANPATGLAIYTAGHWDLGGGTSASAPLWAAILAIGDQMAGRPLGFINPTLYKLATSSSYTQDFHDITAGNNSASANGTYVQGYSATQSWDPITGLGSPNAEKLLPNLIAAIHG
ncbi:MAG TPA: S53 family peptidase [Ktedonobacteraceae bacterium]